MKTKDEVIETPRPLAQRKTLYSSVIAQVTLRTLKELFKADRTGFVETIVFNGYVDTIDKGTGRPLRTCLVTLRTSRDIFMQLDLSRVDPLACLKVLNASVSKSPEENILMGNHGLHDKKAGRMTSGQRRDAARRRAPVT